MTFERRILQERLEQARSARKKGDALRKVGREEPAREAYRGGVAALDDPSSGMEEARAELMAAEPPLPPEAEKDLYEIVEAAGTRAGLFQRLGLKEAALESYSAGARLEARFGLQGTYNRLNAIKLRLTLGRGRLRELEPEIAQLASLIEDNLRTDRTLSDQGWAWADLGDCLAFSGRTEEARRAYATFVAKSELRSPARTLDVLREVAAALEAAGDPDVARLHSAMAILEKGLSAAS
jgi:tetratricopeptide (TPR) repeat protein